MTDFLEGFTFCLILNSCSIEFFWFISLGRVETVNRFKSCWSVSSGGTCCCAALTTSSFLVMLLIISSAFARAIDQQGLTYRCSGVFSESLSQSNLLRRSTRPSQVIRSHGFESSEICVF